MSDEIIKKLNNIRLERPRRPSIEGRNHLLMLFFDCAVESEDVVKEVERLSCKDVRKETVRLLRRGQKHDLYKMTYLQMMVNESHLRVNESHLSVREKHTFVSKINLGIIDIGKELRVFKEAHRRLAQVNSDDISQQNVLMSMISQRSQKIWKCLWIMKMEEGEILEDDADASKVDGGVKDSSAK
ncbi:hypothetical protein Tco_1539947 [Tanacetum coccineum]